MNSEKLGVLLVAIAAISWSTAGLFTRVVSTDIPTTLFWRSLTGGLCVLAIYLAVTQKAKAFQFFKFTLGEVVIAALSTSGMICFISAFFYTSIANVSFVYGTMPLVTFLLSLAFLKARADLVSVASCLLAALGTMFIMWGARELDDALGILLAFGMTFFMASLTIAGKYYPNANGIKATYLSAFLGALATLPFSSFADTLPVDYFWLFLYGFVNVGLGFGVYLLGVQRVAALTAALVGMAEIPIAPIWAWLLFQEEAGIKTVLGGIIILVAAVMYVVRKEIRAKPASLTESAS